MTSLSLNRLRPSAALLVAGLALLCALAGYVLVRSWPLLFPATVVAALPDPGCNLRAGPCVTRLSGGGQVSFGIEPRDLPVLEPLQLNVTLQDIEARSVAVDFAGTDMNMGFNRVELQAQAPGSYTGQGTLSVCVRAAMEWEASVLIDTGNETLAVPFRFVVVRPGQH